MIVIPAIDLKDGQCVRLLQGKKDKVTRYSTDPVEVARQFESCGAELIHIVDLDGAFTGNQKNLDTIIRIRKAVRVSLQVGGGIRNIDAAIRIFSEGIERIVVGTAAIENPEFLIHACSKYPGKILVGIDSREGIVAIRGWQDTVSVDAIELAKRLETIGIAGIVYTDILRDGTLLGPNIEAIRKMVGYVKVPVIAAGGVSSLEDIKGLMKIRNLWGVIIGKAIYSKTIDLRKAIRLVDEATYGMFTEIS